MYHPSMDTATFLQTLGINTHLDFSGMPTAAAHIGVLNYLGIKHIRDCAQQATTAALWVQVNLGTGAKFTAYMPEGSPAAVKAAFALLPDLYRRGLIEAFEGPNEEDDSYAVVNGNSISTARQFMISTMTPYAKSMAKPLINMSFGAGWTAANNWHGDYDKVGDMSPYCDFGNAHTYPLMTQTTTTQIVAINALARMAAPNRPVITTELGWDEKLGFTQAVIAKYVLQAAFGGVLSGNPRTFFYALYDDAGRFGLMNTNGTAKPAGLALHNLTVILSTAGSKMPTLPTPIITVTPPAPHDQMVMLDGLDGSHWLAVWNEIIPPRKATLALSDYKSIIYRPIESPYPTNESTDSFILGDEVALVKITSTSL